MTGGARGGKVGDKVILEPLEKAPFDIEAWRAELVAAGGREFLPEGLPEDEPSALDDDISFELSSAAAFGDHSCKRRMLTAKRKPATVGEVLVEEFS